MGFEENEISQKSNGGTELSSRSVQESLSKDLLEHFQIIPSRPRELKENKIRILNLHDLALDPEVEKLRYSSERDKYHKFIFVSHWQMYEFANRLGMPLDDKMQVIENPIEPIKYKSKEKFEDTVNLVYFSTPQRGLEILVPVFEKLVEKYDKKGEKKIDLHVYSSFNIYGWPEKDKVYEPLFERMNKNIAIQYHGSVSNEVLRENLQSMHILAYPSIWPETSCRVLIEAMSAGLLCVHPNLAALPETSGGLTMQYQFLQDPNEHANSFYTQLDHAIRVVDHPELQKYLKLVKSYADTKYNIKKITTLWESTLKELLIKYPTEESRKIIQSSQMFRYST